MAAQSPWTLVFQDDFNGTAVDTTKWSVYDSPGNGGHGLRSPSAFSVANGILTITAQMVNGQLVSGGMAHKDNYTYGKWRFRVRTDQDPSAATSGVVLTWPQSGLWPQDGENDIYETGTNPTRNYFHTYIHYGATNNQYHFQHNADATQWHTMAMEWGPNVINIYRDEYPVWSLTDINAIPNVPHHLCIQHDAFKDVMTGITHLYADWAKVYQLDPLSVAPAPAATTVFSASQTLTVNWFLAVGATSYNVKRALSSGGPYTTIATAVTNGSYIDSGLTNGTTYFYVVSAVNDNGEGANSTEASAKPNVPLISDNADANGIVVTGAWTTSTATPGYNGANYLHDGNTGATGGKSVRFSPNLATGGTYQIYLNWPASTNRATNVPVDVNYSGGSASYAVNQQASGSWVYLGTFPFVAGATGNVLIRNDGANGYVMADAAKFVLVATPGAAPATLTATAASSTVINLSWSASPGATKYYVKRAPISGGPYLQIAAGVTGTTFSDNTGLGGGTTYYYVVSAVGTGGESVNSVQASATTL